MAFPVAVLLLIGFLPPLLSHPEHSAEEPLLHVPPQVNCLGRCVSKCVEGEGGGALPSCQTKCRQYGHHSLCEKNMDCWRKCKDLGEPAKGPPPPPPRNVQISYNEKMALDVRWETPPGPEGEKAKMYLLQLETEFPNQQLTQIFVSERASAQIAASPPDAICGMASAKVALVDVQRGLSHFSKSVQLESAGPRLAAKMDVYSLKFNNTPFETDEYVVNATVDIELRFELQGEWPFGTDDLEVAPMFHLLGCAEPDLSQALAAPEFHRGHRPDTVLTHVGADLMYRRCRFVFAADEVRSNRCGSTHRIHAGEKDFQPLELNCDTVGESNCANSAKNQTRAPLCGQIDSFDYSILEERKNASTKEADISVNVTFAPLQRVRQLGPKYYVALYGNAENYQLEDERLVLGVNMTDVLAEMTNCAEFEADRSCKRFYSDHSIILDGLHRNRTYGVMICAVLDPRNLSFPPVNVREKYLKPRAHGIFLPPKESSQKTHQLGGKSESAEREERGEEMHRKEQDKKAKNMLRWFVVGAVVLFALLICTVTAIFCWLCRQKEHLRKKRLNLEAMRQGRERYTDFPARTREDPWEMERRNLVIYEDKRLGSGAFGAVYLGKLVGLPRNSNGQLANSLSIGLMRAENPYVAVKMLPEYADELSKSEFLREIALMKSLGYHERLVNMLACVTQSEPYCLVVEYCSDGDLLQFLRARCKYMLELDENGVHYSEPDCAEDFERGMILTLKQLLMFAVQISYGLEYLSQKGFVHRDVAARNILVQDRTHAKIGDFGLCRFIYADSANYKGRGGRLPIKWMSPEAIRHYEFTTSSDVFVRNWSFGVLMFEIITLGGTPYPGVQPDDMLSFLESGKRMAQPDNCPDDYYRVMCSCWSTDARVRPSFLSVRQQLALQLENVSDEYSYLKLDASKDYYNVSYGELRAQKGEATASEEGERRTAEINRNGQGEERMRTQNEHKLNGIECAPVERSGQQLAVAS